MNDRFTIRTQTALQEAQLLAQTEGHPELTPAHLAIALLEKPEGVTAALLTKLDMDPKVLVGELRAALKK